VSKSKGGEIMEDCIFCKIIKGEIPCEKVYEDDIVLSFKDISPGAPSHILIIPKKHISSLNEVTDEDSKIIAHVFIVLKEIVKKLGIDETGYRIVSNCGEQGGQTVEHIHFHVLGGRTLQWPPG
jgi:histidine triad (HIT) family protein